MYKMYIVESFILATIYAVIYRDCIVIFEINTVKTVDFWSA